MLTLLPGRRGLRVRTRGRRRRRTWLRTVVQHLEKLALVFVPLIMWIVDYGTPDEAATVAPVVENNSTGKRISLRGYHKHVVLRHGPFEGLGARKIDCLPLLVGEPEQKPFGKLKTEPAFALSRVDEEIVEAR